VTEQERATAIADIITLARIAEIALAQISAIAERLDGAPSRRIGQDRTAIERYEQHSTLLTTLQ